MLIDLDKFIASMIEAFPAFKEEGRIPCMYKEALEAQGLEYKDGEIVKTQRMVSSDVKEDGCGVSEDKRIMEKIIATIRLYYGVPLEDEAKEMIVWLEKQGSEPNWCHHKVDLSNCSEEYRKAYYDGWNNCNQQHSQCKSEGNDVVPAWTEEDEQYLLVCKNALAKYQTTDKWDASIISRWLETKLKSLRPQPKQEWKQENREELTEFENAMMHIGGSFFGENAGLDPNDTDTIKEQAELLLELAPKTEWSKEDERIYQSIIDDTVQENQLDSKQIDWLKSIKSRVQPKQEWSEEDEKNLRRAIRATKVVYPITADWLKSIRNRITLKPSIEQMKILEKVTGVDIEKTLNGFQNFYAHENSGEFPSAIEIAKHFYKLGIKASDTELENLLWTLPESIADERSHQVYLMSLYHCDGQCVVDYVGELEGDSLVCFVGETFMEAATKMREWIRKRPKLRKI